jgi:hypothetical protein
MNMQHTRDSNLISTIHDFMVEIREIRSTPKDLIKWQDVKLLCCDVFWLNYRLNTIVYYNIMLHTRYV